MNKIQGLLMLATAMMAVGSFADPVQVSVTATAQTTEMGYSAGQSYTFTWTVNDDYSGSSSDSFAEFHNQWYTPTTSDPLLWSSFSGDGLSGTYSRPAGSPGAPYDWLIANGGGMQLRASNDDLPGSSMGLMVNGIEVQDVYAYNLTIPGLDYSDTSFVNPASWLADYTGTHALSGGLMYVEDEASNQITLFPSSATIVAIPEPSTIAFVGIFGSGLWAIRRFFQMG